MPFPARFHGNCVECGSEIEPGNLIRAADGGYAHDECEPVRDRAEQVCSEHWLVQPCGECEAAS